jgi:hypothetical protein
MNRVELALVVNRLPHTTPLITQITLNSVECCFPLSEIYRFRAVRNVSFLQLRNAVHAFTYFRILVKRNLARFLLWPEIFYIFFAAIS